MKLLGKTALFSLIVIAVGCAVYEAKEARYLESAQGKATQEEVRQRLGAPHLTASTKDGEPIWVYQVYQVDTTNQNSWGAPGAWCDEYVLTFNQQNILLRWTHKSEGHPGEVMPTYCVTDGFKSAS